MNKIIKKFVEKSLMAIENLFFIREVD
jgi:hypothetical protein